MDLEEVVKGRETISMPGIRSNVTEGPVRGSHGTALDLGVVGWAQSGQLWPPELGQTCGQLHRRGLEPGRGGAYENTNIVSAFPMQLHK